MHARNHGFTLVELAATVAILAICIGVGLPSLNDIVERQRAAAATSSLLSHISLARIAAVTRNRRTVLCPSLDGSACADGSDWSGGWMLFVDDDGNRKPDAGEDILRADLEPISRHLRLVGTSGRQQLRYLPDGRSAGTNLTISICNSRNQLLGRVIVNNMGRPRSERPQAPTPCPG